MSIDNKGCMFCRDDTKNCPLYSSISGNRLGNPAFNESEISIFTGTDGKRRVDVSLQQGSFGAFANFVIYYCPMCGRKLND